MSSQREHDQEQARITKEWERKEAKRLAVVKDPMAKAMQKAYRASLTAKLDELLERRSKWSRRSTVAQNKLSEVETEIRELLCECVGKLDTPAVKELLEGRSITVEGGAK